MEKEGISYWSDLANHSWDELWMNYPAARARANQLVTGRADLWPIACLRTVIPERLPLARTASIGCGTGNLERSLVELDLVGAVTGVDYSQETLKHATESAMAAGMGDRIRYVCQDAREFLAGASGLDAIFFHSSLHHFDRLPSLLKVVNEALAPDGILYLDEYVGPARDEWTWRDLLRWNRIYWSLPRSVRRTRIIRRPISRDDPSEAIESSGIIPSVELHFDIVSRRDYGGNLLAPIYPSLRRPDQRGGPDPEVFDAAVRSLLQREQTDTGKDASFHTVIIARPRKPIARGGPAAARSHA